MLERRRLLHYGALASMLVAMPSAARSNPPTRRKRSILVLGGTEFLGPATIEVALAHGHQVTMFNRGKTRPDLFPQAERLHGNRDPKIDNGLDMLKGRRFDVVIDNSGYRPRHVAASADLLAANGCGQYIFISSISCYREPAPLNGDEDTPLATLADPTTEEMGPNFENYGGLKALCEQAAQRAFGDRATIVRPGYIVGPDDPTGRFTYWPVRFHRGGQVAVPGTRNDPFQIIDVRDLGAWLVRLAEDGTTGKFNAVGPRKPLRWGSVVRACQSLAPKGTQPVWIPASFLDSLSTTPDAVEFPIWAPAEGPTAGFHTWRNDRAWKAGLRFRSAQATLRDTLSWYQAQEQIANKQSTAAPTDGHAPRVRLAGPSAEQEAQLLARFKARAP